MYKPYYVFYLFIIFLSTNFFACNDDYENYSYNPQDLLTFSIDTLSFDTVLTTVNSPVLAFRVYNKNTKPLLISSVQLSEGENSNFKINVDGTAGTVFENVVILAKDSILVLVDVKPKETGKLTPAHIIDYVVFETNNIKQKVVLEAFSQDVYVWRGVVLSSDSILDNQKPYLIYDNLVIDSGITVKIEEGSIFYMHNNAQLIVRGTIKINGSIENPVIFRGSRTDNMVTIPYDLIPGQWGGISFASESYDNELENVRIRNGTYGMNFELCDDPDRNKLYMKNVVLTNVSEFLIQALNCNIIAENCEFSNAKDVLLFLAGGSYRFTHCTISNYYPSNPQLGWVNSENEILILTNAIIFSDSPDVYYLPVIKAEFLNTILSVGKNSSNSEILIMTIDEDVDVPFLFKNCILPFDTVDDPRVVDCLFKVDDSLLFQKTNPNDIEKNTWYPSFDFRLQKDSPAQDAANLEIATQIPYDLNGFYRLSDGLPDMGAYEYHDDE